jgi:hypothetical protein
MCHLFLQKADTLSYFTDWHSSIVEDIFLWLIFRHIYLSIYLSIHPSIDPSIHLSVALQSYVGPWSLFFSVSYSYTQSVGLLGREISTSQGRRLHTEHEHRINADIHALIAIQTHNPSVRASEDSSCLRPRGHCDGIFRLIELLSFIIVVVPWS